jgi:phosphoglycerol transferase MdoB-like AlkP superfamily enzyme
MVELAVSLQVVEATSRIRSLVVVGSFLLTAILGTLITHRAYEGYRRNRSKPMLYLALGLVLVTVVPPVVSLVLSNLTALPGWLVVLAMTTSQICGLVSILYSLYGNFRTSPDQRARRS